MAAPCTENESRGKLGFCGILPLSTKDIGDVKLNENLNIADKPKTATGIAKKVPIENIDNTLYKTNANMNAFKMKAGNVSTWIQVLNVRYYQQFGDRDDYNCDWVDVEIGDVKEIEEIQIHLSKIDPQVKEEKERLVMSE